MQITNCNFIFFQDDILEALDQYEDEVRWRRNVAQLRVSGSGQRGVSDCDMDIQTSYVSHADMVVSKAKELRS